MGTRKDLLNEKRDKAIKSLRLLSDIYPEFDFIMFDKDTKLLDVLRGYRW